MKPIIVNLLLITLLCNASYAQIVLNELFPDPSPSVQLPEEEFVELYNTTGQEIDLSNYTISDASKTVTIPSGSKITANGFVILCAKANIDAFQPYGDVIALSSLPSLNNSKDEITLANASGDVIDFVAYQSTWYKNDLKKSGGWTLERINPTNSCDGEANWTASTSATGGTPGTKNSVYDASFGNNQQIELVSTYLLDAYTLELTFNKKPNVDATTNPSTYSITPNVPIQTITLDNSETVATIVLETATAENTIYKIAVNNLADCAGSSTLTDEQPFGLTTLPEVGDIILNEVLFNPATGGVDFIEITNTTTQLFSLDGLKIIEYNLEDTSQYDDFVDIVDTKRYLLPNELYVLTTEPSTILEQYNVEKTNNVIDINIPNYNDDEGIIGILNEQLTTLDQLHYYENWHFEGLNRVDGVSLERLNKTITTQDETNWYSASVANGSATPTAENSQVELTNNQTGDELLLSNKIFTPDNDGIDDFLTITFQQDKLGITGSVFVYNVRGYLVKTIVNNQTLGVENQIRWTGLDDDNQPLPIGHYIIVATYYDANGNETTLKEKVVLSRR